MLIAVDAFGGDYAPQEIVKGAVEAANQYKIEIALVGQKPVLRMLLRKHSKNVKLNIIHASQIIDFNEHPVEAIRSKRDSSIVIGTNLVRDGIASAFVSAGNTGAILAAAYLNLKKVAGIERPALCGVIQINPLNPVLLIDAGANVDCRSKFLVQFAELGNYFAQLILGVNQPRIALLNVGEEDIKGNFLAKETFQLLKKTSLNFIGNIEGHEILKGKADVIVTDGFTGNIILKTMEGFGEFFQDLLKPEESARLANSIQGSALVHYTELLSRTKLMDYKEYGGACLLGVNGNIIVAHGRSQAKAIKNAIFLAHQTTVANIADYIKRTYSNPNKTP
jgi:glycerol-3-phosphate acyltransferase PlsX